MYRSVVIGISLLFLLFTALVYSALSLPNIHGHFQQVNDDLIYTDQDHSVVVSHFKLGNEALPPNPHLLFEEPDVLPRYEDMTTLFNAHSALFDAAQNNQLALVGDTGEQIPITFSERSIQDLPWLFWLQALCAFAASVICLLVWIPSQKNIAVVAFCLTGVGYVCSAANAAIYSTRDVFIDGQLFHALSNLNGFGTMCFVTFLGIFLWHYPNSKPRKTILVLYLGAFAIQQPLHHLEYFKSPAEGMYSWVMVLFLWGLVGSAVQWRKTAGKPAERVALNWVLLSILSGTLFFTGGMIIPVLLRVAEPSDQALLLATFLFMYFGMMLAVLRYRLFDIQRWSFSIWSWILGGIAVLVCDFVLISALTLTSSTSLAISLALVGWLYFPARQWLWRRVFNSDQKGLDDWLRQTLPTLLTEESTEDSTRLIKAFHAVFKPLHYTLHDTAKETHISNNGENLWVAMPHGESVCLQHADGGRRIFNRNDMEKANLIIALSTLITDIAEAKQAGALAERNRIRRDLHDDLGAKLLRLLHLSTGDTQSLVRESIRDLRHLINGQQFFEGNAERCFSVWQKEASERCSLPGVSLSWSTPAKDITFTPMQHEHLGHMLRETLSNALRHDGTTWIDVTGAASDGHYTMTITNNTHHGHRPEHSGSGLENLRLRAELLNGEALQSSTQDTWTVTVSFPLT